MATTAHTKHFKILLMYFDIFTINFSTNFPLNFFGVFTVKLSNSGKLLSKNLNEIMCIKNVYCLLLHIENLPIISAAAEFPTDKDRKFAVFG